MSNLHFDRDFQPHYGLCQMIAPNIRRVLAPNPGPFTFHGTGTYILGESHVAVIDPGPLSPEHLDALLKAVEGETVEAIFITHTHLDHSPLSKPLQQRTRAPIYGFEASVTALANVAEEGSDAGFAPDHALSDGDIIEGRGWSIEAIHTPGHMSNHLCFAYLEQKALFCGDHIMGWSTTVVCPPDGNMADYMASLEKLTFRTETPFYPTHGNPVTDPPSYIKTLLDHRRQREDQIEAAIAAGLNTIPDIVTKIYTDIPVSLHPAAAQSVLAHLIHMVDRKRVLCNTALPERDSEFRQIR